MRTLAAVMMIILLLAPTAGAQIRSSQLVDQILVEVREDKVNNLEGLMKLTEDEKESFWSKYEEYAYAIEKLDNRYTDLLWKYVDSIEEMTDEQADASIAEYFTIEEERLKLKHSFAKEFREILPPVKLVRFIQIENKFESALLHKIATVVPVVK